MFSLPHESSYLGSAGSLHRRFPTCPPGAIHFWFSSAARIRYARYRSDVSVAGVITAVDEVRSTRRASSWSSEGLSGRLFDKLASKTAPSSRHSYPVGSHNLPLTDNLRLNAIFGRVVAQTRADVREGLCPHCSVSAVETGAAHIEAMNGLTAEARTDEHGTLVQGRSRSKTDKEREKEME